MQRLCILQVIIAAVISVPVSYIASASKLSFDHKALISRQMQIKTPWRMLPINNQLPDISSALKSVEATVSRRPRKHNLHRTIYFSKTPRRRKSIVAEQPISEILFPASWRRSSADEMQPVNAVSLSENFFTKPTRRARKPFKTTRASSHTPRFFMLDKSLMDLLRIPKFPHEASPTEASILHVLAGKLVESGPHEFSPTTASEVVETRPPESYVETTPRIVSTQSPTLVTTTTSATTEVVETRPPETTPHKSYTTSPTLVTTTTSTSTEVVETRPPEPTPHKTSTTSPTIVTTTTSTTTEVVETRPPETTPHKPSTTSPTIVTTTTSTTTEVVETRPHKPSTTSPTIVTTTTSTTTEVVETRPPETTPHKPSTTSPTSVTTTTSTTTEVIETRPTESHEALTTTNIKSTTSSPAGKANKSVAHLQSQKGADQKVITLTVEKLNPTFKVKSTTKMPIATVAAPISKPTKSIILSVERVTPKTTTSTIGSTTLLTSTSSTTKKPSTTAALIIPKTAPFIIDIPIYDVKFLRPVTPPPDLPRPLQLPVLPQLPLLPLLPLLHEHFPQEPQSLPAEDISKHLQQQTHERLLPTSPCVMPQASNQGSPLQPLPMQMPAACSPRLQDPVPCFSSQTSSKPINVPPESNTTQSEARPLSPVPTPATVVAVESPQVLAQEPAPAPFTTPSPALVAQPQAPPNSVRPPSTSVEFPIQDLLSNKVCCQTSQETIDALMAVLGRIPVLVPVSKSSEPCILLAERPALCAITSPCPDLCLEGSDSIDKKGKSENNITKILDAAESSPIATPSNEQNTSTLRPKPIESLSPENYITSSHTKPTEIPSNEHRSPTTRQTSVDGPHADVNASQTLPTTLEFTRPTETTKPLAREVLADLEEASM